MAVDHDGNGRTLQVGDPVTLYYGGIANRGHVGTNSRGTVAGFGRVNVQVRISDSRSEELVGGTYAVPGSHLAHGHVGYVRAADQVAELQREYNAEIEKAKQDRAREVLMAVIELATKQAIITEEQGRELWSLRGNIPRPLS